jgi:hypothetical protein
MIEESLARVVLARRAAARGSRMHKRWWLIAKNGNSRVELLTTDHGEGDCGETLVIFGHEEEAEIFLYLGGYGDDGWRVRESSSGEIVSVLYGPCSGAEGVALDPLPVMMDDRTLRLVWLGRERFLDHLLGHSH